MPMEKRSKQSDREICTKSLFDCAQPLKTDQANGYIFDELGSRKTLVGKGTLSMPIQRYPDKSEDNSIPPSESVLTSVLDDPDANANIASLFDLLLRIDKRNHPELYD